MALGHGHSHGHGECDGHGHGQAHGHSHGHAHGAPVTAAAAAADTPTAPAEPLSPLDELFLTAKRGDLDRFKALVTEHGKELVQQRDAQGHTLAHWVAQRGSAPFLEYIHSLDAPLDLPSEDTVKLHPIHWACSSGNLVALKTFVKLGVDINTADVTKNRTPLLLAAQNGFPLLVMYCVKNGADVTIVDIDKDSAIHWAAYKGATEIVSMFQYLGLQTDEPDRYGQTPLHLAAMRGELATVQYLVEELDSNLHVLDAQGRTPLQLAKLKGFLRVVKYLEGQMFRSKWNILSWWEASRTPYYFVVANFVLFLCVYPFAIVPFLPELRAVFIWHLFINLFMFGSFYMAKTTPPGDARKDKVHAEEYSKVTEAIIQTNEDDQTSGQSDFIMERPLCHTCHIQRPLRSKHCRVCKTCIHMFDHHCPFIDNCVGRDNYVYFVGFAGSLALDALVMEYVLYTYSSRFGIYAAVVLYMVFCFVLVVSTGYLFGLHVFLTARNLTTNELMNSHRYQHMRGADGRYRNPFDQGIVRNFTERCLPAYMANEQENYERVPNPADIV
ncbi:TPA: hypothetical protein N0F65_007445 [Lagenidium giganteum]|uniref:Palmitoyltransferase n=1 Tax=Lagenidium giganteum TaxID=4803 RepID=A0AAV2ZMT0_9STRA|nr:TPA: hypothetical protein N0F65_007445 [Lagenidium giganteum]